MVGSMVQLRLPTNSRISEPDAGDGSLGLGMIADYMDSLVTYEPEAESPRLRGFFFARHADE